MQRGERSTKYVSAHGFGRSGAKTYLGVPHNGGAYPCYPDTARPARKCLRRLHASCIIVSGMQRASEPPRPLTGHSKMLRKTRRMACRRHNPQNLPSARARPGGAFRSLLRTGFKSGRYTRC